MLRASVVPCSTGAGETKKKAGTATLERPCDLAAVVRTLEHAPASAAGEELHAVSRSCYMRRVWPRDYR